MQYTVYEPQHNGTNKQVTAVRVHTHTQCSFNVKLRQALVACARFISINEFDSSFSLENDTVYYTNIVTSIKRLDVYIIIKLLASFVVRSAADSLCISLMRHKAESSQTHWAQRILVSLNCL